MRERWGLVGWRCSGHDCVKPMDDSKTGIVVGRILDSEKCEGVQQSWFLYLVNSGCVVFLFMKFCIERVGRERVE